MKNNGLNLSPTDNSNTSLPLIASKDQKLPRRAKRINQKVKKKTADKIGDTYRKPQGKKRSYRIFDCMEIPWLPYTLPRVVEGKQTTFIDLLGPRLHSLLRKGIFSNRF